jgi:hypothetical protein
MIFNLLSPMQTVQTVFYTKTLYEYIAIATPPGGGTNKYISRILLYKKTVCTVCIGCNFLIINTLTYKNIRLQSVCICLHLSASVCIRLRVTLRCTGVPDSPSLIQHRFGLIAYNFLPKKPSLNLEIVHTREIQKYA